MTPTEQAAKVAADKVAADKVAANKVAANKAEAERLAARGTAAQPGAAQPGAAQPGVVHPGATAVASAYDTVAKADAARAERVHPGPTAEMLHTDLDNFITKQTGTDASVRFTQTLTWIADRMVEAKYDSVSSQALADLVRAQASRMGAIIVAGSASSTLPPTPSH